MRPEPALTMRLVSSSWHACSIIKLSSSTSDSSCTRYTIPSFLPQFHKNTQVDGLLNVFTGPEPSKTPRARWARASAVKCSDFLLETQLKDFRAVQNKHHTCQRNTWYKTLKKTQSNKNMCDLYCVSENLRAVVQLRNYNKCLHVCLCVLQGFKHTSKKKRQVSLPDVWCKNMHLKVKTAKGMQRIHPLLKTRHRYLIVL